MKSKGFTPTPTLMPFRFLKTLPKVIINSTQKAFSTINTHETKKLHQSWCRGFTLIELLIVIAIIGILASVVTASLNSARSKGADAAIKVDLTSIRVQSSIWYDDNGLVYAATGDEYPLDTCPTATSTGNIFADLKIFEAVSAAYELAGGVANSQCVATADAWAVAVQLKTSDGADPDGGGGAHPAADAWCTDSVGSSRSYSYGLNEGIAFAIDVDACR